MQNYWSLCVIYLCPKSAHRRTTGIYKIQSKNGWLWLTTQTIQTKSKQESKNHGINSLLFMYLAYINSYKNKLCYVASWTIHKQQSLVQNDQNPKTRMEGKNLLSNQCFKNACTKSKKWKKMKWAQIIQKKKPQKCASHIMRKMLSICLIWKQVSSKQRKPQNNWQNKNM